MDLIWPASVGSRRATSIRTWSGTTRRLASSMGWRFLMASADSAADVAEANRAGWRTFRMKWSFEPYLPSETGCPASDELGHRTDCATCALCDGLRPKKNVAINAHGRVAKQAERRALRDW